MRYLVDMLLVTKGRWADVERDSGVSRRTFEKIVHGQTTNPRLETVEKLKAYFSKFETVENLAAYFRERDAA